MLRPLFVLTFVATAFAAASCGGDGETSTSGGVVVTADEACAVVATNVCAKLNDCSAFLLALQYGDEATCKTRIALTCPSNFSATGSNTTAAQGKACGEAIADASCDDIFERSLPDACTFDSGTLADGDACSVDAQCKSAQCNKQGKECGVCAVPSAAGGTCVDSEDCAAGLSCALGKCIERGDAGATCNAATPCKATLACSGGKCAKPLGAGAPCDMASQDCDNLQGLGCNKMNVCQKIKLAGPGEVCGFVGGDVIGCNAAGRCKTDAGGMGTCLAAAADGAACDEAAGPGCMAQAVCASGTCTLGDAAICK